MVAGATIRINTETRAHPALALLDGRYKQWLFAALAIEHAFAHRNDHLRARFGRGQCFFQSRLELLDPVRLNRTNPLHAQYRARTASSIRWCPLRVAGAFFEDKMPCPPVAAE